MSIKAVKAANFKSFENLDIELGKFNVLIGPNASGKSNFVDIFRFLGDIASSGLYNAISMQGGVEYLRNIGIGASKDLHLRISSDREFRAIIGREGSKGPIAIKTDEIIYRFSLRFHKRVSGFKVVQDELVIKFKIVKLGRRKGKTIEGEIIEGGSIKVFHSNGKVEVSLPKGGFLKKGDIFFPPFMDDIELSPDKLLLETVYFLIPFPVKEIFDDISIHDFDPKLPKKAYPITGKAELEENGENLSIVLRDILQDKEKSRKLFNLVKELLPFVEDLDIEKLADKSLLFKLRENYFTTQYIPASLISDGTINVTALITSLYFEKKSLLIIEEPERNIHPYLISKVVDIMKDTSRRKQIIVTTHNPEFVKHADLENILLVHRNERGFSVISRVTDKKEVETFLENDIGIDELYVQNLL